jgi:hypothetical protein
MFGLYATLGAGAPSTDYPHTLGVPTNPLDVVAMTHRRWANFWLTQVRENNDAS